jgi:hypothetical protein
MVLFGGYINKQVFLEADLVTQKYSYTRFREFEAFLHPAYVFLYTMIDDKYESLTTFELYHKKLKVLDCVRKNHIKTLYRTYLSGYPRIRSICNMDDEMLDSIADDEFIPETGYRFVGNNKFVDVKKFRYDVYIKPFSGS